MMRTVKAGDHVTIEYKGMIDNGEVVESSAETGPFELEVGKGLMPPGFEKAVLNMQVGEEKSIVLPPDEAYGEKDENLLHTLNRSALGENVNPKPGMVLGMKIDKDGRQHKVPALVTAVKGDEVTIDFNHPLAGRTITYKISIKAIR